MSPRLAALLLTATALASPAAAQPTTGPRESPRFAFSLSPTIVVPSGYKAAEIEARVRPVVTFGLAAGTLMGTPSGPGVDEATPAERLVHGDVFARWFFSGEAFNGWSIGVRGGLTRLPGESTHPGLGADVHRHWAIGRHLVGNVGWGMKRVFGGHGTAFDQRYVPWIKAHVGVAF